MDEKEPMKTRWHEGEYCGPGNKYHYGHCLCHVTGPGLCVFHDPVFGIFTVRKNDIERKIKESLSDLEKRLEAARNAALEEAAKAVESINPNYFYPLYDLGFISKKIRAMKEE